MGDKGKEMNEQKLIDELMGIFLLHGYHEMLVLIEAYY
jgi:hypothetical protein